VARFSRASQYNPAWAAAAVSGGANPLWLTEWLTEAMDLRPGMRVLDLGCGRAVSSIFLHREYDVDVWAADLWFSAAENLERVRDAGADRGVFPIHADARALPFAPGFFDAIVSIDSYVYFGTDDHYLANLARFVRPGGPIGIAGAGLSREIDASVPAHLVDWWTPDMWCLHSAEWWRRHWERAGVVDIEVADTLPDGWRLWLDWLAEVAPGNTTEIQALTADAGATLGYTRVVGRRRADAILSDPVASVTTDYKKVPLRRGESPD
jgi:cyclopropane fatty-acyl-phospholipid synthase-like methyltransferase